MISLTPALIEATDSDEKLFELIKQALTERIQYDFGNGDELVEKIKLLPKGLRAMAAVYELDVSLWRDDLGWHFGNWHHHELAEETALGLEELGANEMASIFREAYAFASTYWSELGSDDWSDWYLDSPLDKALFPLNDRAWTIQQSTDGGLLDLWASYARRCPERMGS